MSEVTNANEAPLDPAELASVKEELRRAQEDLERFAQFVSHDFRAPLRHISAFSGLLEEELRDHENRDIETWLGFMASGARLIQELVDEVLAFSRARRESAEVGKTVIAEMLADLQVAATGSEGSLIVKSQIDADVVVAMPTHHARQIFAHLFRNTISFRKKGEAAQISLTHRSAANGEFWEIEVRDEGRGISEEDIQYVFDSFYRSSDSPRESPGLGLTVARHLLSLYGGTIAIESELGAFTTVRMLLPAARV